MRLSDVDIEFYRRTGHLDITPWDDDSLQAASYDLHLGCYVSELVPNHGDVFCDCEDGKYWEVSKFDEGPGGSLTYTLPPHAFRLFSTVEVITISGHLAAAVAGKSSRAREGIAVEFAGWVDPGFTDGQITLEVKNNLPFPITLTAGMPICQITFEQLRTPTQRPYSKVGHYNGQRGPTASWAK